MSKLGSLMFFFCMYQVFAGGIQDMNNFLQIKNISAKFEQVVNNKRYNYGIVKIARPNKFIWSYDDGQEIISNGLKVYLYDKPLKQVIIRKLNQSLEVSPASILAGDNNLNKHYKIFEIESAINSVELIPKHHSDFKKVILSFDKLSHMLSNMILFDNFSNVTHIYFSEVRVTNFENNIFSPSLNDVDVLSE